MTTKQLREEYVRRVLPAALLEEPAVFYQSFTDGEGEVMGLLTAVWTDMCADKNDTITAHPFFPELDFWIVDDTEDGFACMMDVYLPAVDATPAIYAALVFGATMDPRYFAGFVASDGGVRVTELQWSKGNALAEVACGMVSADVAESDRRHQFMERVYAVCASYSADA